MTCRSVHRDAKLVLDWSLMVHSILADVNGGVSVAEISAKFHNALAEAMVAVAKISGLNARGFERRLFSKPLPDRTHRGAACARKNSSHIGISACRRTTAASRWDRFLRRGTIST